MYYVRTAFAALLTMMCATSASSSSALPLTTQEGFGQPEFDHMEAKDDLEEEVQRADTHMSMLLPKRLPSNPTSPKRTAGSSNGAKDDLEDEERDDTHMSMMLRKRHMSMMVPEGLPAKELRPSKDVATATDDTHMSMMLRKRHMSMMAPKGLSAKELRTPKYVATADEEVERNDAHLSMHMSMMPEPQEEERSDTHLSMHMSMMPKPQEEERSDTHLSMHMSMMPRPQEEERSDTHMSMMPKPHMSMMLPETLPAKEWRSLRPAKDVATADEELANGAEAGLEEERDDTHMSMMLRKRHMSMMSPENLPAKELRTSNYVATADEESVNGTEDNLEEEERNDTHLSMHLSMMPKPQQEERNDTHLSMHMSMMSKPQEEERNDTHMSMMLPKPHMSMAIS